MRRLSPGFIAFVVFVLMLTLVHYMPKPTTCMEREFAAGATAAQAYAECEE